MSNLDLNNPPPGHSFKVNVDKDETSAERNVRLFKDVALFVGAIVLVGLVVWLSVRTILSPTSSPDQQKMAWSFISAAAGGLIGYLVRK